MTFKEGQLLSVRVPRGLCWQLCYNLATHLNVLGTHFRSVSLDLPFPLFSLLSSFPYPFS